MKKKIFTLSSLAFLAPIIVLAQDLLIVTTRVQTIINYVIPIVGALLLIYFFWGIAQYVSAGGDDEKRTAARNMMIYAVIGMFVAFSIFGLVRLLGTTVGLTDNRAVNFPGITF